MDLIDVGLYVFYFLMLVSIVATVVFPLANSLKNPEAFKKSVIGVGALVVLFGVLYALTDSSFTPQQAALGVGAFGSKMIGAGLRLFYITLIGSVILVVFSEINKALK